MVLRYLLIKPLQSFFQKIIYARITLMIDQEQIRMKNKVKFLGWIFDTKLCWKQYIDYIKSSP